MRRGETGFVLSRAILIVRGSSLANDLRCSDVATGNRWEAMKRIVVHQITNTVQVFIAGNNAITEAKELFSRRGNRRSDGSATMSVG